ncbi:MAG: D-alanine--D-alanine ligase [Ruminococcaceae bacterium]|nr:D-alanine--D-alanine ligase [Oscillospiraceae bacterium]
MKIAVLAGGLSTEREVSLSSGSMIANSLVRSGHSVCFVDIYTGLGMNSEGFGCAPEFTDREIAAYKVARRVPDLERLKIESGKGERRCADGVLDICREADVVFNALHGDVGENGQLQALLDMEGIRYTGSGYVGSALAMDKDITKRLLSDARLPTPHGLALDMSEGIDKAVSEIMTRVGFPCVIKPCSGGSSVGISMPDNENELRAALAEAAKYEDRILAERKICGREFAVGIVGDTVLPPVEIIPKSGFYDYENKYQAGKTREVCPPENLSDEDIRRLNSITQKAFSVLRLEGYARFDYIMDESGEFWILEANTLPGMTPTSLLPFAASAAGIGYDELCKTMVRLVLEK